MRIRIGRIRDALHFAGTLSLAKMINYFLIRSSFLLSRISGKAIHRGMPVSLSVEPTTSCNLRCPECPSGLRQFTRPQGKIRPKLFHNIIDQLKGKLIYLLLYFQGEPMLHPGFVDMVRYAKGNNIYTATSTNGHYLDNEDSRKIISSGLDRLIISLDGTDQETYGKYRIGGDLEKVLAGIRTLVAMRKEMRSTRPYIILQFLVFKNNEHQLPEIKQLARDLKVDKLDIKAAQVYNFEDDREMIPQNSKYSRYIKGHDGRWRLKKPLRNSCMRMWSGAVMTWDGKIVPCCFDKDANHQMGDAGETAFREIWRSRIYKKFRQQILKDRKQIEICRNCTE